MIARSKLDALANEFLESGRLHANFVEAGGKKRNGVLAVGIRHRLRPASGAYLDRGNVDARARRTRWIDDGAADGPAKFLTDCGDRKKDHCNSDKAELHSDS